jgi:hypothetical protein
MLQGTRRNEKEREGTRIIALLANTRGCSKKRKYLPFEVRANICHSKCGQIHVGRGQNNHLQIGLVEL